MTNNIETALREAPKKRITCLCDWKREGGFIATEFRAQLGGYDGATNLYDKATQVIAPTLQVDYGIVFHVGEHGVKPRLVLNRKELDEAFFIFVNLLTAFRYFQDGAVAKSRYLIQGKSYVSVTQVLGAMVAKPALMNWAYMNGLEAMATLVEREKVTLPLDWSDKAVKEQLKELVQAEGVGPNAKRDAKGEEGTRIHRIVEYYLKGQDVDLTEAPKAMVSTASNFALWATKHHVEPKKVEQVVFHETLNYAGKQDSIIECDASVLDGVKPKEG